MRCPLVNLGQEIMRIGGLRSQSDGFFIGGHRLLGLSGLSQKQPLHQMNMGIVGVLLDDRLNPATHLVDIVGLLQRLRMQLPRSGEISPKQTCHIQRKIWTRILLAGRLRRPDPRRSLLPKPVPVACLQSRFDAMLEIVHNEDEILVNASGHPARPGESPACVLQGSDIARLISVSSARRSCDRTSGPSHRNAASRCTRPPRNPF